MPPPSATSFVVYVTQPLTLDEQSALLTDLNRPARPSGTSPFELYDPEVGDDGGAVVGKSVEEVVDIHKSWAESNGVSVEEDLNGHILVVVNDISHPRTVLVVNAVESSQEIRVLLSNAHGIISDIQEGKHEWSDFWNVAEVNGGHYPGE
ncbi:hypothetical protein BDN72DRAFT_840812 [Pluteus cervinus]|uniref:Uncharacterized protein n=1 Tax=Pluteus cervinus TaxID=181527 RepID=A0ACD3AUA7_9AGAR|nr:hypothetical protein BDN72DRAFT_840812 [Pluteus cervinus]